MGILGNNLQTADKFNTGGAHLLGLFIMGYCLLKHDLSLMKADQ